MFEFKKLQLILGFLTNFKEGATNILLWLTEMLPVEHISYCRLKFDKMSRP